MLQARDIHFSYGAAKTLHGVSFEVRAGEIVALIGANGAGKTTTMRCISGILRPTSGEILFREKSITNLPAHKIGRLGIAHVLEGRHLFKHLTVRQNLEMGFYHRTDKSGVTRDIEWIYSLFPRIRERDGQVAGTLSGGEQQMVAMGRSLISKPDILLLDEPSMGLSPRVVDTIFEVIVDIAKTGLPIFLVEQNANRSLAIADRAYVLELGRIVTSGTGAELSNNEKVRQSYLGESI
jgi:branched-chain amino acid transport system ATP-binding protein